MGVTRRRQPKLPITKSVAAHCIREFLRFVKKYNLYFSEINRECSRPGKKAGSDYGTDLILLLKGTPRQKQTCVSPCPRPRVRPRIGASR